jgi:hypothetical protein
MTMERDFWIPNLSGEVSGKERLQACIDNYSSDEYDLTLNEGQIILKPKNPPLPSFPHFELIVTIPDDDRKGMCHIECSLDATPLNIFIANEAWKEFRSALDGCYGAVYNCTGMDEPFNKFHKKQRSYLHETNGDDYVDVVNRFIQSVEQSSDTMNYLWKELQTTNNKNHERIAHESLAKAESNKLYFDSFVSLYSGHFETDWLENKKREMELRIDKAKIAYSTIYKERKNDYEHSTIRIARIALFVSILAIATNLIISVIQLI